jgi:hypothetical protein
LEKGQVELRAVERVADLVGEAGGERPEGGELFVLMKLA